MPPMTKDSESTQMNISQSENNSKSNVFEPETHIDTSLQKVNLVIYLFI